MIRVATADDPVGIKVIIDGELSGQSVEVVEACCNQALSKGKPVELLLRDVLTIDACGRALLCRLAIRGVRLSATGIYTSYVLREIESAG